MRPWLLVASDFVRTGGMDVANLALAEFLGRQGTEVHLVTHRTDPSLSALQSVTTHRTLRPLSSNLLGEAVLELVARSVYRKLKLRKPVIIVNGGNARLRDSVNWVHFVHEAYRSALRPLRRSVRARNIQREKEAFLLARMVIADSLGTARDLREFVGVPAERIRTVYYGIDASRFRCVDKSERNRIALRLGFSPERRRALFVGALGDGRKGLDTLLLAWHRLQERDVWDVDLLVVGTGRIRGRLEREARERELRSVTFLGFRTDVADILKICDLMVAPSRYEPYGQAVHEALCSGVPAIVSRSAGVAERYPLQFDSLLLDDPTSVEELTRCLREWRANESKLRTDAVQLSATLRLRSWDDMAAEIVSLIGGDENNAR